jgi:hypothetical protein
MPPTGSTVPRKRDLAGHRDVAATRRPVSSETSADW